MFFLNVIVYSYTLGLNKLLFFGYQYQNGSINREVVYILRMDNKLDIYLGMFLE